MLAPIGFESRVAGYSNQQLAEILASGKDYTPAALEIVLAEWERRKLTADKVIPALENATAKAKKLAEPLPTRPMAFKGIGLICYGRDYGQGAGYVTTQWFCIFAFPLFPIRSFRVNEVATGVKVGASEIPRNMKQVVRTYLFLAVLGVFAAGAIWLDALIYNAGQNGWGFVVTFLTVLAPFFFVQFMRRAARQRPPNHSPETAPGAVH